MHELMIAQNILDKVIGERERLGLEAVLGITVKVGALSGVFPDALQFGFDALCRESELDGCRLTIESVPITIRCRHCHAQAPVDDYRFSCEACGSTDVDVETGYELDIAYIEVGDADADPTTQFQQSGMTNGSAH